MIKRSIVSSNALNETLVRAEIYMQNSPRRFNMCDKAIQVSIGSKRIHKVSKGCQVGTEVEKKECASQCGTEAKGSYSRSKAHNKWRFDDLLGLLHDKKT